MTRLLLGLCVAAMATAASAQTCVVNDPSGTPLNVRARPYGAILGALHNGAPVEILDVTWDGRGRQWAYVAPLASGRRGWVFRDYLACN